MDRQADDRPSSERPAYAASDWHWVSAQATLPPLIERLAARNVRLRPIPPRAAADCHEPMIADAREPDIAEALFARGPGVAPLILIGCGSTRMRAALMEAGADDALPHSVGAHELALRMRRLIDHYGWRDGRIGFANLHFDVGLKAAWCDNRPLSLMPREFDLLLYLARSGGAPVGRKELLSKVWQLDFDPGTNSIEVHVSRLRRRLEKHAAAPTIVTVKGRGYRLVGQPLNDKPLFMSGQIP